MNSDEINERLAELARTLQEAENTLGPLSDQEAKIRAEEKILQDEFNAQMTTLRKKMAEVSGLKQKSWREKTLAEQEAERLKEQLRQEEALKAQKAIEEARAAEEAAKNKVLTERFDALTLKAHWREWAKDHQIKAAHIITENRNVIEADVMGLGKTLTSIISAEMAFFATKEASEEFPMFGEEHTIKVPASKTWTKKAQELWEAQAEPRLANYWKITAGEQCPYLDYDRTTRFLNEGFIEKTQAHEKTEIIGAITRPVGKRVLYLCPSALIRNVEKEWRQWAPHRNVVFIESMTKAERDLLLTTFLPQTPEFVVVCNYEAWVRDKALLDKFVSLDFDFLIIDEAHNAKNMNTSIYKGIDHILKNNRPEYVVPMTGTPILNRPEELYTLLHMIDPVTYFHLNDFLYKHCIQVEDDETGRMYWKFKEGGLERLKKNLTGKFIRRTKDDAGIILPPKSIIEHTLEVDEEAYPLQAKARKEMRTYMTVLVGDGSKAIPAAVKIAMFTRLRQIETWPAGIIQYEKYTDAKGVERFRYDNEGNKVIKLQLDVEESQKVDYIIKRDPDTGQWDGLIPEAIEDERLVLFSQFKAPLREIARRITAMGKNPVILDGDTPKSLANEIHEDFDIRFTPNRDKAKWDIVLCNYRVGGVGLNLTAATQLIVLDEEWNPGKRDQAYDRIHRMGQEKPVTIHLVRNAKTIDDWLAGLMNQKEGIVDGFQKGMMSTGDIKNALDSGLI